MRLAAVDADGGDDREHRQENPDEQCQHGQNRAECRNEEGKDQGQHVEEYGDDGRRQREVERFQGFLRREAATRAQQLVNQK